MDKIKAQIQEEQRFHCSLCQPLGVSITVLQITKVFMLCFQCHLWICFFHFIYFANVFVATGVPSFVFNIKVFPKGDEAFNLLLICICIFCWNSAL